jgi:ABC-type Fe3+ transport system substrate-binding protein
MTSLLLRLVAGAGLLAAAATAQAQSADWAKVIEAAKKEGKVTLYTSTLGAPFHTAVLKSFEKKYGISAELLDVRASELRERIRTEQSTNRFIGDVLQGGAATTLRQQREGQLQPHGGLPNLANLRDPFKATDSQVPSYVLAYGVLVNTNLVKPADEPKSWKDLLDAKWKGKKGLPVKLLVPAEGAPYIQFDLAVLRNAPHPNAARLFIDHYLSEEAQLIYANAGLIPVSKGVAEKANDDVKSLVTAKLMGTTHPDTQDAMLDLAKKVYK